MARKNDRRNAGLWFLGILGLILTAIGLRYASSSSWWTTVFGGDRRASQTVNTGASVFMSTPATPAPAPTSSPAGEGLLPPSSPSPSPAPPTQCSTPPCRKMW